MLVASFTDAWIETAVMSRLKDAGLVASFTDAWIETPRFVRLPLTIESHLLQMRGLKQHSRQVWYSRCQSHLLQMRGLKRESRQHVQ